MELNGEVYVEYCNLPMKLAFQNVELFNHVSNLMSGQEDKLDRWTQASRTFRQLICLNLDEDMDSRLIGGIYARMDIQDKVHPYMLTMMYPYLAEDTWTVDMRDISYMKVDIRRGEEWRFSVKKVSMHVTQEHKAWCLRFYPYETDTAPGLVMVEGSRYMQLYVSHRKEVLIMMKQILLNGTLDLECFEVLHI